MKVELSHQLRTSQLWLSCMHYIHLMKAFIFTERQSNWELHLDVVTEMLNLFAATGHTSYAKSVHLYVLERRKLPETHLWLHTQFMNGHHTVQRTPQNGTGIWKDLAIKQTLMRSIESRGGLTGGSGNEGSRTTTTVSSFWTGLLSGILSLSLTTICCLLGLYQLKEMISIARKPNMLAELSRLH